MPTESDYTAKIQTYDWDDLKELWQDIQDNDTPDWSAGKALEYFIIRSFELENASISYPYSVPMNILGYDNKREVEQIDGVVYVENIACLIECKDCTDPINFEPIAKLRSQLMRRPATGIASIFSIAGFTAPALTLLNFIHPQTILAWEKDEIDYCLKKQNFSKSLIKKYHKAIELGTYNFPIIDEEDLL